MRPKFQPRQILLRGPAQLTTARALLEHIPIDPDKPLELLIREQPKVRGMDANARMWAGQLFDIAAQAWYKDRQYSAEVWHLTYKRLFLPEVFDPELCKEGYRKWDFDRDGNRVLVGSTTQLTQKGFSIYLTQIEADGASMGVMFHASPNEVMA